MHIEPGIVDGAKLALGAATAAGSIGCAAKLAVDTVTRDGIAALAVRTLVSTGLVFGFFEVLPHAPVGVSEVHFIFGSTLFLLFGAAPAAFGLALGLLVQGLTVAPWDLPQYGMNVTSLLAPLFAMGLLARRIIPAGIAYKDVTYGQALALSTTFQAGVVAWVAFWAFYGQGFGAETLTEVGLFGGAYLAVVLIEPLLDLAVLAWAKGRHRLQGGPLVHARLCQPAT